MCHSLSNTWDYIVETTLKNTEKKIKKYLGVNIPVEALRRTILSKDTNNYKKTGNLLTDLVRGFIPKYLTNKLEKKIKGNNNKRNIMRIIINGLQEGFY